MPPNPNEATQTNDYVLGFDKARLSFALAIVLMLFGGASRFARYAHNPDLRLDEALLALNVIEKPFSELLGPLERHQNSPYGFLYGAKAVISVLGDGEWALRLIPFASGLISILLFYALVRRLSRPVSGDYDLAQRPGVGGAGAWREERWDIVLVALAFFAVGRYLLFFSSDFRHYSLDVLFACLLYLLAIPALSFDRLERKAWRRIVLLIPVGAVAVWFSLTAIFVLGGIGGALLLCYAVRRYAWETGWAALACLVWVASFYVHLQIHEGNIEARDLNADIEATLGQGFMPLPPTSVGDIKWFRETFELQFYEPGGLTYRGLAGFAFILGCLAYWKRRKPYLLMLLLPIALALFASGLHRYPYWERFIIFLVPVFYLFIAEGIGFLMRHSQGVLRGAGVALLVLLYIQPFYRGARETIRPYGDNGVTPLLAHVQDHWQEGDFAYFTFFETPPYEYYRDEYPLPEDAIELEQHYCEVVSDNEAYRAALRRERIPELLETYDRVWIFYGHDGAPLARKYDGRSDEIGVRVDERVSTGVTLYLYARDDSSE